jgi:hypothetical protein
MSSRQGYFLLPEKKVTKETGPRQFLPEKKVTKETGPRQFLNGSSLNKNGND